MKFQPRLLCNSTGGTAKFPSGMLNEVPWNGLGGCGWLLWMWNSGMHPKKQEQLLPGGNSARGSQQGLSSSRERRWEERESQGCSTGTPGGGAGMRIHHYSLRQSPKVTPVKLSALKPGFNLSFKDCACATGSAQSRAFTPYNWRF